MKRANQLLSFWVPGFMRFQVCPIPLTIDTQILLFHCDVVLLAGVLPLFVEVDQLLVQHPIEQFEILQTSLDILVFPEPILSSADVVQHILDFVVATRLPCVVLEDPILYVSRIIAHLASTLLLLLPLPDSVANPHELDLLLGKNEISVPCL